MNAGLFRLGCWLVLGLGVVIPGFAREAPSSAVAEPMSVQIKNDRLTMMLVKYPQVYLSGRLDAAMPQRFEALLRQGRIPDGADVYLDSANADPAAGMALGRIFRAHQLVTHVGARTRLGARGTALAAHAATCVDGCLFAYLGGLYRWAPSGTDRVGLNPTLLPARSQEVANYLLEMGLSARQLTGVMQAPAQDMVWLDTRLMLAWMVANNGRLALTASYQQTPAGPQLTYLQTTREGRHRVILACAQGVATLTAIDELGPRRSMILWPSLGATYFEIGHRPMDAQQGPMPRRLESGLQFERPVSLAQIQQILETESLGAWMRERRGSMRYGFTIGPVAVRNSTQFFLEACRRVPGLH